MARDSGFDPRTSAEAAVEKLLRKALALARFETADHRESAPDHSARYALIATQIETALLFTVHGDR